VASLYSAPWLRISPQTPNATNEQSVDKNKKNIAGVACRTETTSIVGGPSLTKTFFMLYYKFARWTGGTFYQGGS